MVAQRFEQGVEHSIVARSPTTGTGTTRPAPNPFATGALGRLISATHLIRRDRLVVCDQSSAYGEEHIKSNIEGMDEC